MKKFLAILLMIFLFPLPTAFCEYIQYDEDYYIVPLTISSDKKTYSAGQPITISVHVIGGVPPFNAEISVYEGNGMGFEYTPLSEYNQSHDYQGTRISFTTNNRDFQWTYTPPVNGSTLYGQVYLTDGNGITNHVIEDIVSIEPAIKEDFGWKYAYYNFVLNEAFYDTAEYYYDFTEDIYGLDGSIIDVQYVDYDYYPISAAVFDDGSDIPVLIIHNGCDFMAGATCHVYKYINRSVRYIGSVGFRECGLYYTYSKPGLYCTDGNNGVTRTEYYEIGDSRITVRSGIAGKGIYHPITLYPIDSIRGMTCDEFSRTQEYDGGWNMTATQFSAETRNDLYLNAGLEFLSQPEGTMRL